MAGALSSLNTALSGLRYQQSALDIASTNIANASTDGYVRRRILGQTVGASTQPAVWSRSTEIGSGVQSNGVERMVDALLDVRVRREHARQTYLDVKTAAMGRIETGIAEPSDSGVAAALTDFRSALHDLVNSPGSEAARSQVVSSAAVVADAFRIQANNLSDEAGDQRAHLLDSVQEVNDATRQLAETNKIIATARANGTDVSSLMDTRDQLALRITELTGASATVRADGGMDVVLKDSGGDVSLVSGGIASQLAVTGGVAADGSAIDGGLDAKGFATTQPVTFTVVPDDGGASTPLSTALGGEIGGTVELLDVIIPGYGAQLNQIVKDFASSLNDAQAGGIDSSGSTGGPLFEFDDANPALTIKVTDGFTPGDVAAADPLVGGLDASNADKMAEAITVDDAYQRMVNGFGSAVASVQRLSDNQKSMSTQVDAAREQLAGVNIDEETVNMLLAQRSYQAAARVMTTVDEMLDTLINRTGMVGR